MKKIYAVAIMATRSNKREVLDGQGHLTGMAIGGKSGCILANSPKDAENIALLEARKWYPRAQGWEDHAAHVTEVPRQFIDMVA